jgi:hypothetical protein
MAADLTDKLKRTRRKGAFGLRRNRTCHDYGRATNAADGWAPNLN